MNKNSQIMAVSVALWLGLGTGTTSAALLQTVLSPLSPSSLDAINNSVVFDSSSLLHLDNPAASDHSELIYLGSDSADGPARVVHSQLTSQGPEGSYSGNISAFPAPEPEKYAMLLIVIGLLGFTLHHRKMAVPQMHLLHKQRIFSRNAEEF